MKPLLKHLDQIDGPKPAEVARIKRRLSSEQHSRLLITAILTPAGLAMAAAAVILLGALPSAEPIPEPPPDVTAALSEGAVALTGQIQLTIAGQGTVSGTARDVTIDWQSGRIDVSVTPQQGIDLSVRTEDALISVVGTEFSVEHSALGSQVEVERGAVAVQCRDMTMHSLTAGQSVTCRAAATLGSVVQLQDMGAPADEVLAEIQRALASRPQKTTRGALLSEKIAVLLDSGRRAEAQAAAWVYLSEGHTAFADEFNALLRDAAP